MDIVQLSRFGRPISGALTLESSRVLVGQLSFGNVVLELVHNGPSAFCMARKLESPEEDPLQLMGRDNPGNDYLENRKLLPLRSVLRVPVRMILLTNT